MDNLTHPSAAMSGRAIGWLGGWLLALGVAQGCADSATPMPTGPSVCPDCSPQVDGPTGDSDGWACSAFMKQTLVDEQEAVALGYTEVSALRQRIERPIDAPLHWQAMDSEAGEPAAGYEPNTHIMASLRVRSLLRVYPDPERCDGTTCRGPDADGHPIEAAQAACKEALYLGADLTLETADGAVSISVTDDPDDYRFDTAAHLRLDRPLDADGDPPGGTPSVDLLDVTGSLQVFPSVPEPYFGDFYMNFDFGPDRTSGFLLLQIYPDWDSDQVDRELPSEQAYYTPLEGRWGN